MAVEKHGRYLPPFVIERCFRMRLVCALVPVPRVFAVAFPAMQVGVDPRRLLSGLVILRDVVGAIKVPLGIPPQSLQLAGLACRGY